MEMPSKLQDSLGFISGNMYRAFNRRLQKNFRDAGHPVTVEQFGVLVLLWEEDGIPQQRLACALGKDKPSVTRLLDYLEQNDLIVRIPDQNDRRIKLIYLTRKGKDLENCSSSIARKTMEECMSGIPREDVEKCEGVLKAITSNLCTGAEPDEEFLEEE